MLEITSEKRLKHLIEDDLGGKCIKVAPTEAGLPDRLVILPGGVSVWVEMKQDSGRLRRVQKHRIQQLRDLGQEVWVVFGPDGVDRLVRALKERLASL